MGAVGSDTRRRARRRCHDRDNKTPVRDRTPILGHTPWSRARMILKRETHYRNGGVVWGGRRWWVACS